MPAHHERINGDSKELSIVMIVNLNSSDISFSKVDNYYRHIVAPLAHRAVDVRAAVCVEPELCDFRQLYLSVHLKVHKISRLLVRVELPDSVAAHNQEVSLGELEGPDVRHR